MPACIDNINREISNINNRIRQLNPNSLSYNIDIEQLRRDINNLRIGLDNCLSQIAAEEERQEYERNLTRTIDELLNQLHRPRPMP